MKDIIIAIDGHAASGKGTIAKQLAQHFDYKYVDTGAMYRAITFFLLENKIPLTDIQAVENALQNIFLDVQWHPIEKQNATLLNGKIVGDDIRSNAVNESVSQVASLACVREFSVQQQQAMGKEKKIVMDGRDIGTKVFPNAELKLFITADLNIRAERRFKEMQMKGMAITFESVYENLAQRDNIDSNRTIDPLKQATDAILIDNSKLSLQEQLAYCLQLCKNKIVNSL